MQVTVRFFGPAADRPTLTLHLDDRATVADAIAAAKIEIKEARIAVGTEYAEPSRRLRPGDVLSLIPPVGGG